MRKLTKREHFLVALLALVSCFPLAVNTQDVSAQLLARSTKTSAVRVHGLTLNSLTDAQKSLLRRYQRAHACPPNLDDLLPGFQALCQSLMPGIPAAVKANVQERVDATQSNAHTYTLDQLIDAKKNAHPSSWK
jgi:hypothetical protein